MYVQDIFTVKCLKAITWSLRRLVYRLSKHQFPTKLLFTAPVTHVTIFSQGMLLLGTNHFLVTCYLYLAKNIYISIGWEGKLNALIFLEPIQSFYISMELSSFLRMTYITNDNYYSSWNHETHQEDDGGHWGIAWIVHHGKCFRHVTIAGCHKHQPGSKSLQWLQSIKFQANIYLTTVK